MAVEQEKNLGGRPPIYEAIEDNFKIVSELCDGYFEYIKGDKSDETNIRESQPPTVTGLTLYLGFESKDTLYSYAKKDGFSYPIKKALTRIEQFHEIATAYGDKCVGNIFVLKNFNWKDTHVLAGDKENPLTIAPITGMKIVDETTD